MTRASTLSMTGSVMRAGGCASHPAGFLSRAVPTVPSSAKAVPGAGPLSPHGNRTIFKSWGRHPGRENLVADSRLPFPCALPCRLTGGEPVSQGGHVGCYLPATRAAPAGQCRHLGRSTWPLATTEPDWLADDCFLTPGWATQASSPLPHSARAPSSRAEGRGCSAPGRPSPASPPKSRTPSRPPGRRATRSGRRALHGRTRASASPPPERASRVRPAASRAR